MDTLTFTIVKFDTSFQQEKTIVCFNKREKEELYLYIYIYIYTYIYICVYKVYIYITHTHTYMNAHVWASPGSTSQRDLLIQKIII